MRRESDGAGRPLEILVWGLEAICGGVVRDIKTTQYNIHFACSNQSNAFNEYDGVVVFQDVFERVKRSSGLVSVNSWVECDRDGLDRRQKDAHMLLEKGGFIVLVQTRPFYDYYEGRNYRDTDLIKRFTNYRDIWRNDLPDAEALVSATKPELVEFCATYGRAYSSISITHDHGYELFPLVKSERGAIVGYSLFRNVYIVPSMKPRLEECERYFSLLISGIISIHKKRQVELPEWAAVPFFDDEKARHVRIEEYEKKIAEEKKWLEGYARCKRVLFSTGEELVADVALVLTMVSGVKVDTTDEKKEDSKLIDKDGRVLALVEVKGVNGNLKLSHVAQSYEHRERTAGYENLPVLLVANTYIGTARSLEEKDRPPPDEQIEIAAKHKVLVLRTIDLLNLLRLCLSKKLTQAEILKSLLERVGWWRVEGPAIESKEKGREA